MLIEILFCGICHSDIHQARDEWGGATFPMVPGHEIVGRVRAVGDGVTSFKVGDLAGVGCMVDSCRVCDPAAAASSSSARRAPPSPTTAPRWIERRRTYGGYSTQIVVAERFTLKIPAALDPAGRRAASVRRHHHLLAAPPVEAARRATASASSASAVSATWRSSSPRRWAPR